MSRTFMFVIGLMYLAAAVAAFTERKWALFGLGCCWGAGNLILAYMNE